MLRTFDVSGGSTWNPGGSNEPPELNPKKKKNYYNIFYFIFPVLMIKIKF